MITGAGEEAGVEPSEPAAGGADVPREAAARRLLSLQEQGRLVFEDVRLAAEGLAVSERTVWRWLERTRALGELAAGRERFEVTDALRERLLDAEPVLD